MTLDIIKVRQEGEKVLVSFTALNLPKKSLTRQTRRLRNVYKLAHDSIETAPPPLLITQEQELPMEQNPVSLEWEATTSAPVLEVIYRGITYELRDS